MKLSTTLRSLLTVSVMLLAGCVTTSGVGFKQYKEMAPAERSAHKKEALEEIKVKKDYDEIQSEKLLAGLPVQEEFEGVKFTKIWDKSTRRLSIYEGHVTGAWGSEILVAMWFVTNENDPSPYLQVNRQTGKLEYTIGYGNGSVQETALRAITKAVVGPAFNGFAAQVYRTENGCRGGACNSSGTVLVNQVGGAQAIAGSAANAAADAAVDAALDGLCPGCKP